MHDNCMSVLTLKNDCVVCVIRLHTLPPIQCLEWTKTVIQDSTGWYQSQSNWLMDMWLC